jgi:hypothetical protein
MRGSEEAFTWLMKNGFPHFGALDRAIDGDPKAYAWLQKNDFQLLTLLAGACNAKPEAIEYFNRNNLPIFLLIARKFIAFRDSQTFDHHKKHF